MIPANWADGGVSETTRRFQVASAAFLSPAWRPMRGSGFGAVVDMLSTGAGVAGAARVSAGRRGQQAKASEQRRERAETMANVLVDHGELPSEVRATSIVSIRAISVD